MPPGVSAHHVVDRTRRNSRPSGFLRKNHHLSGRQPPLEIHHEVFCESRPMMIFPSGGIHDPMTRRAHGLVIIYFCRVRQLHRLIDGLLVPLASPLCCLLPTLNAAVLGSIPSRLTDAQMDRLVTRVCPRLQRTQFLAQTLLPSMASAQRGLPGEPGTVRERARDLLQVLVEGPQLLAPPLLQVMTLAQPSCPDGLVTAIKRTPWHVSTSSRRCPARSRPRSYDPRRPAGTWAGWTPVPGTGPTPGASAGSW